MSNDYSRDPDDLYGETIVAKIEIAIRKNGAMSVAGNIEDLQWALAMLDAAKDSVRNYHDRNAMQKPGGLIIPARDTGIKIQ